MCEIAIVDPEEYDTWEVVHETMEIYRSQRSSLGLVAVYRDDEQFNYDTFVRVEPTRQEVRPFIEEHRDAGWLIIHGRMATCGDVNEENAHPLEVDCPECDVDYVLHNGVVARHRQDRDYLEEDGHVFNTEVDSEVLAHHHGRVPNMLHEEYQDIDVRHQPAYILLNDTEMFIYTSRGYWLSEHGYMAKKKRTRFYDGAAENYEAVTLQA